MTLSDTCIGNRHDQRSVCDSHACKTPDQIVKVLVDIVSKNGSLMLNVPVRGGAHSEAARPCTAKDFRFTTKGNTLYATALGWPDSGKLTIRTLASDAPGLAGKVQSVSLLGSPEKLAWTQTADGLVATMPAIKPVAPPPPPIRAAADGTFPLTPDAAETHGGPIPNRGCWNNPKDTAVWNVHFDQPITGSVKVAAAGAQTVTVKPAGPATWKPVNLAVVTLTRTGNQHKKH